MSQAHEFFRRFRLWWRHIWRTGMAQDICVGLRKTGTIDVDICMEDGENDSSWNTNNLTLEQAEYLVSEVNDAIRRARLLATQTSPAKALPPGPYSEMK